METTLHALFSMQKHFINLSRYENEFETMRLLFDKMSFDQQNVCKQISLRWLETLKQREDTEYSLVSTDEQRLAKSDRLRREGNTLFNASEGHRNVLAACRLYNDAIFEALDCGNSSELSLAFANRAMALQTFGYYQQAYDDCTYAIDCGYPATKRYKLTARQAYCALKIRNVNVMEQHVLELQRQKLNENFQKQLLSLESDLETLKKDCVLDKVEAELQQHRETQEIIDSCTDKGIYMRAKTLIKKNSLIFSERASSFVPVGKQCRVCHQCCITNFIPYPCLRCRGRVVYCSRNCQQAHQAVHQYECAGYRFQLFSHLGIGHLALRTTLDNGIFTLVDRLKSTENLAEIWKDFSKDGEIWTDPQLPYAESLRMISHLDKIALIDIKYFAISVFLIVQYLRNYTTLFEDLQAKNPRFQYWDLLISALILRHIGQLAANGHNLTTITHRPMYFTVTEYPLLNDNIWSSALHMKTGYLHTYSHYSDLAVLNLPYLSICNHSCVQSFQPRFSGRCISTYALRDLHKGDEITNTYEIDSRKVKRAYRRAVLKSTYHFDCRCEDCILPEADKDFNKYHQYRCDNTKCRQVFVPDLPEYPALEWWDSNAQTNNTVAVRCTKCGCDQQFEWFERLQCLISDERQAIKRRRAYQLFRSLENTLLGLNDARADIADTLVSQWFQLPNFGISLEDKDYQELADMVNYKLEVIKSQVCVNSIQYVADMAYIWDLIALGKYKYSKSEMEEMLFAIGILSDDMRVIFLNYYNDYILAKAKQ